MKSKHLYAIAIAYFAAGFINIHFALLAFLCLLAPFILLAASGKKLWCRSYCPRASLLSLTGGMKRKRAKKLPKSFLNGEFKRYVLIYFIANLVFIAVTTYRVATRTMYSMNYLRFLMFFPIPAEFPQIINIAGIAPWVTHLAYRFYSMMLTTVAAGLLFAVVYRPRVWCAVCPVSNLSDKLLKKKKSALKV